LNYRTIALSEKVVRADKQFCTLQKYQMLKVNYFGTTQQIFFIFGALVTGHPLESLSSLQVKPRGVWLK
jgi:hypothetical protein